MTTKVRLKIGRMELDYEGSEEFLKLEIPELCRALLEVTPAPDIEDTNTTSNGEKQAFPTESSKLGTLTTSTIASAIGAKSGGDLAQAAAGALVLGGKESFSRAELLASMQTAKAYYKASFRSNLSNYITSLIKSRDFLDHGNEMYGLREEKRQELENALKS